MRTYYKWSTEKFLRRVPITCWDIGFQSIKDLSKHPRCIVPYDTLYARIKYLGWNPESAATTPAHGRTPTLWGCRSLKQIAAHPNCKVGYVILKRRLEHGMDLETAATLPKPTIKETASLFGCSQYQVRQASDLDTFEPKTLLWGYDRLSNLAQDKRCVVPLRILQRRVYAGWPMEKAATTPQKR